MRLAIDTCVLSVLCNQRHPDHGDARIWLQKRASVPGVEVYVPAIADYELRRGLLHAKLRDNKTRCRGIEHLDSLCSTLRFLPIDNAALRRAADLWADARHRGKPTASAQSLDADVILAAQALIIGATVVTDNQKHLSRYCAVEDWKATA